MPPKKRQKTQEQRSQPHFVSSSSSSRYFRVEKVDDFTQQCIYHLVLDMVFLENETTSKNRDEKNKRMILLNDMWYSVYLIFFLLQTQTYDDIVPLFLDLKRLHCRVIHYKDAYCRIRIGYAKKAMERDE
jgi:hypothetical protein